MERELDHSTKYIANKYIIDVLISEGSFGKVYKGFHKKTREPVAIKIDFGIVDTSGGDTTIITTVNYETNIINYLFNAGVRKIPEIYWYGFIEDSTREYVTKMGKTPCLVMTLYECSLYDYMLKKTMTTEKLDIIFGKILNIFESIHKHYVLHRDIKPQNFMVKNGDIFLIDFGLSTFYMSDTGIHYPDRIENTLVGTPKFASIYLFKGHRYSRRDDFISIGYMYLYMLLGQAPWDNDLPDNLNIMHSSNQKRMNNKNWENFEPFLQDIHMRNTKIGEYIKTTYHLNYMETAHYCL